MKDILHLAHTWDAPQQQLMRRFGIFILMLLVTACQTSNGFVGGVSAQPSVAQTNSQRNVNPTVDPAALQEVVTGNNTFAIDLYKKLPANENLVFSPFSISAGLSMVYGGARSTTKAQMASTLHYELPLETLQQAFNALDLQLNELCPTMTDDEPAKPYLSISNSVWGQEGFPFQSSYIDTLQQQYGAALYLVDFATDPEGVRQQINQWISTQTSEHITDFLPANMLTEATKLALINAMDFGALWQYRFDAAKEAPFHLIDQQSILVPMMTSVAIFPYIQMDTFRLIELPYRDCNLSMVILLPNAGQFRAVTDKLDANELANLLSRMETTEMALTIPKFTFGSTLPLADTLRQMGMVEPFSTQADFSGIAETTAMKLDVVIHKSLVDIDELGTKATATTATLISPVSARFTELQITVDRPFLFLIYDRQTQLILFTGRVMDPSHTLSDTQS